MKFRMIAAGVFAVILACTSAFAFFAPAGRREEPVPVPTTEEEAPDASPGESSALPGRADAGKTEADSAPADDASADTVGKSGNAGRSSGRASSAVRHPGDSMVNPEPLPADGKENDAADDKESGDDIPDDASDDGEESETDEEDFADAVLEKEIPSDTAEPETAGAEEGSTEAEPGESWEDLVAAIGYNVTYTHYLHPTVGIYYKVTLSPELQAYTYEMCSKYRVPYSIVIALMGVESSWNADIGVLKNKSGSYAGLGMLSVKYNAQVFKSRGINIYTPEGNIEAICWVLRDKLAEFDGNIHYALMAYNMGSGGARTSIYYGRETSNYSRRIVKMAANLLTDVEYAVITKK